MHRVRDYELQDSSPFLGNGVKLRTMMREDGYLFFRNLLPRHVVETTTTNIVQVLRRFGYVDETSGPVPKWSRKPEHVDGAVHELQASGMVGRHIGQLESLKTLYTSRELIRVFEAVFKGDVFPWVLNSDRVKVKLPGRDTYAHQDTAYYSLSATGRAIPFYVAWVPLMEIGEPEGCVLHGDVLSFNDDRVWGGADYHPGDVLIFHRRTVHIALPNASDVIRLSADFRYQKKGTHLDFRSRNRQATVDQFCVAVRQRLTEIGVVGVLADRIVGLLLVDGPTVAHRAGIAVQVAELMERLRKGGSESFCFPDSPSGAERPVRS